jgi:IS5 family transposase
VADRWRGSGVAQGPDETTICRFRHLLEKLELGGQMLDAVNHHLDRKGIHIAIGTIVDAQQASRKKFV